MVAGCFGVGVVFGEEVLLDEPFEGFSDSFGLYASCLEGVIVLVCKPFPPFPVCHHAGVAEDDVGVASAGVLGAYVVHCFESIVWVWKITFFGVLVGLGFRGMMRLWLRLTVFLVV